MIRTSDFHALEAACREAGGIIAIDGRSGSGKSTLAAALAERLEALLIEGDDFFIGGLHMRDDTPAYRAATCIDWRAQRAVLHRLRAGQPASWQAFDWDAFDGSQRAVPVTAAPHRVVILEGVYSARPELAGLLDLRILLEAPAALREVQLRQREGELTAWDRQWHMAEDWYFAHQAHPEHFDIVFERRPA